jgi:hypothetical protein
MTIEHLMRGHRLDDAGIAIAPIKASAGEEPHPIAVAAGDQAIAIVLDLDDGRRSRLVRRGWRLRFREGALAAYAQQSKAPRIGALVLTDQDGRVYGKTLREE